MLFTWSTKNVSVGGGGTIDCNGDMWRDCAVMPPHSNQWNLSRSPCNNHGRPHCVLLANATDVVFEDVTVLRPGDWNTHFSSCTGVRVRRINVTSEYGKNNDGIDIDSCRDVVVEDSWIHSGDDAIAMKSGKDWWGRRYGRPTRDVLVRNVTIDSGYGMAIGSETSGSIINVYAATSPTASLSAAPPSGRRQHWASHILAPPTYIILWMGDRCSQDIRRYHSPPRDRGHPYQVQPRARRDYREYHMAQSPPERYAAVHTR
jgi:hypothetical protein